MFNNKKGNIMKDFIYEYGWAILIVLVAIGALAYYEVFDEKLRSISTPISPYAPTFSSLRINHYLCQSREYFSTRKKYYGNADGDQETNVKSEEWWITHDQNNVLDYSVELYVQPIKNLIDGNQTEK